MNSDQEQVTGSRCKVEVSIVIIAGSRRCESPLLLEGGYSSQDI